MIDTKFSSQKLSCLQSNIYDYKSKLIEGEDILEISEVLAKNSSDAIFKLLDSLNNFDILQEEASINIY